MTFLVSTASWTFTPLNTTVITHALGLLAGGVELRR